MRPRAKIAAMWKDPNPFAPLHRRLGIATHVHRQAVLLDIIPLGRGGRSKTTWDYDPVNRVWSNNHLFRASVTLAGQEI